VEVATEGSTLENCQAVQSLPFEIFVRCRLEAGAWDLGCS
jgi:hypothetical protein